MLVLNFLHQLIGGGGGEGEENRVITHFASFFFFLSCYSWGKKAIKLQDVCLGQEALHDQKPCKKFMIHSQERAPVSPFHCPLMDK